jgi:hypothetical protein
VKPFWLWTEIGLVTDEWRPSVNCTTGQQSYFFTQAEPQPADFVLGQWCIWAALIAIVLTLALSVFTQKVFNDDSPFKKGNDPAAKIWPIIIGTGSLAAIGLFTIRPYREHITPFGSSLLVLFSIFAAITAIILSIRYSEYRFKKSFVFDGGDRRLEVACWFFAVAVAGCGLWFFGKSNLPAFLVSDLIFVTVLVAAAVAIMLLPFKVAGDLLYTTKRKWVRVVGKLLIGIWHLVLQILVPYTLIRNGNFISWTLAAVLLVLPVPLAQVLMKKNSRVGLSLLWLAYGGVMLTLPWIPSWALGQHYSSVFASATGWMALVQLLRAVWERLFVVFGQGGTLPFVSLSTVTTTKWAARQELKSSNSSFVFD